MKRISALCALALFLVRPAWAATFQVEHDHLFRSCRGEIVFGETDVEYRTAHEGHARVWKYEDIQQMQISARRISILTYEDRRIEFGADRSFNFTLLSGELDDAFRREIRARLSRPLVSSVLPEETQPRYTIPVRHRRFLSGDSEGKLELSEDAIVYRAGNSGDSRIWLYEELLSLGSTGPFQLRLGALQKTGGEYGEEKNYVFDLKRRLLPEEYDFLWGKINRRRIDGR